MKKFVLVMVLVAFILLVGCNKGSNKDVATSTAENTTVVEDKTEVRVDTYTIMLKDLEEVNSTDGIPRPVYYAPALIELKNRLSTFDNKGNLLAYAFSAPFDNEGRWQTTLSDIGEHPITITRNDGASNVSKKIIIIVKE